MLTLFPLTGVCSCGLATSDTSDPGYVVQGLWKTVILNADCMRSKTFGVFRQWTLRRL